MGNYCSSSKVTTHDTHDEEDIMVSKCIVEGKNDITEQLHSSASSFYKPPPKVEEESISIYV